MVFSTNSTERARFTSAGFLGVGTTSPTGKISSSNAGGTGNYNFYASASNIANPNSTGVEIIGAQYGVGGNIILSERQPNGAYSDRTDLVFRTNTGFGLGQSDKMRLDAGGTLTVGTTASTLATPISALSSVASASTSIKVWNFNDTGGGVTNAGIDFVVGSDQGTCSIRSIRTNAGSDYQSALQFLTNPAGATIVPTLKMTINSTGAVVLAGGTTSANGVGITFPATQSASSDANTLDDYEEGTWTPSFATDGIQPSISYSVQTGQYVKIGRQVFCEGYILINSISSQGTGGLQIAGLPFTNGREEVQFNFSDGGAIKGYWSATATQIYGYMAGSSTKMFFRANGASSTNSRSLTTGSISVDYMLFAISYYAAA